METIGNLTNQLMTVFGNLVYTDDNKISLTNGVIYLPSTKTTYLEPVILSEEILLKCGFEKNDTEFSIFSPKILIHNNHLKSLMY